MSSRKLSQSNLRQRRRRLTSRRRLSLESLEHRRLLATVNWDGGPSGLGSLWSDPENWVGDAVPGAADDVVIGAEFSSATIEIGTPTTINSISSHAPLILFDSPLSVQSLTLESTLTTQISSELIIGGGQATGSGSIINHGSIRAQATSFLVGIENRGTLKTYNNVSITGVLTTTESSVITIPAYDSLVTNGLYVTENFTNHGVIELTSEATANYNSALLVGGGSGQFTNSPTGTLRAATGTTPGGRFLYASVVNLGAIDVQESLNIGSGPSTILLDEGSLQVASGKQVILGGTTTYDGTAVTGSGTVVINGVLNLNQDLVMTTTGPAYTFNSATINGPGRWINEREIILNATLLNSPVENRGTLKTYNNVSITGSLTTTESSVITIPAYDSLVTNGLYVTENFTNHGVIELTSEASVGFNSALLVGGGSGQFTNSPTGTLRAATGTTPGGRFLYASVVNQGTLQVQASLYITESVFQTALVHTGTIIVESDAVLNIPNGIELNDFATVSLATNATLNVSRLYGNLQNSPAFSGDGRIVVSSQIEVFSEDRGANRIGYTNNSSLGNLKISGSVQLLDVSDNANSSLPEALYAETLILGLNSTFNLNGYKVYVRNLVDQGGTVLNGQIEVVPLLLSNSSILENQPVNSLVGRFSHFDANLSPEMQYELIGGDISAFKIVNGRLLSNVAFDFETKSRKVVIPACLYQNEGPMTTFLRSTYLGKVAKPETGG